MRENILRIEADPAQRIVRVGDKEFDKPKFLRHYMEIPKWFDIPVQGGTFVNSKNGKKQGNKQYNQSLSEQLGMPASLWKRRFNYEMATVWVDPIKQFEYLYRGWRGRLNTRRLMGVWDRKETMFAAVEDGQENLIPLIFIFDKTPSELKKLFGKGEWKRFCRNSRSRNLLIANCLIDSFDLRNNDNMLVATIANRIPSTILTYRKDVTDVLLWAAHNRKGPLKDQSETHTLCMLYRDTKRMAGRLSSEFNPNWSLKKMYEKHEKFTDKINEARYGTQPFKYEFIHEEYGEFSGDLLMSPKEVANEGGVMRHCVASYAEYCSSGGYAVFSIKKNGEKYSTLGMRKREDCWLIEQHYKACNQRVDSEEVKTIAELLCKTMNEVNGGK